MHEWHKVTLKLKVLYKIKSSNVQQKAPHENEMHMLVGLQKNGARCSWLG